jgi:hypothetical protein
LKIVLAGKAFPILSTNLIDPLGGQNDYENSRKNGKLEIGIIPE